MAGGAAVASTNVGAAVALADVVDAVIGACTGKLPSHSDLDLVERHAHSLRDVVVQLRAWLGLEAARREVELPLWAARAIARVADMLGFLGWRSPLRSTTLRVLAENVVGDPAKLEACLRGA